MLAAWPVHGMAWHVCMGAFSGGARMPARSVCLVTLSLSEAGPGRFGRQVSVTDIYHTMPYHAMLQLHTRFGRQVRGSISY